MVAPFSEKEEGYMMLASNAEGHPMEPGHIKMALMIKEGTSKSHSLVVHIT